MVREQQWLYVNEKGKIETQTGPFQLSLVSGFCSVVFMFPRLIFTVQQSSASKLRMCFIL